MNYPPIVVVHPSVRAGEIERLNMHGFVVIIHEKPEDVFVYWPPEKDRK
jgi:hypothetical protein